MIGIEIDATQLKRLRESVGKAKTKFGRELAAAVNQVSRKTKLDIGRDVRGAIAIKKAKSEESTKVLSKATADNPRNTVRIEKTPRLSLHHFGARQDQRGVSYKINKRGGRQRIDSAFQGPRPGQIKASWNGLVLKRSGKSKIPIYYVLGVSVWGAYLKQNFGKPQIQRIRQELSKQMERRIKLNILRASGLVSR
jgi:hypothetical protein